MKKIRQLLSASLITVTGSLMVTPPAYSLPILDQVNQVIEGLEQIFGGSASPERQPRSPEVQNEENPTSIAGENNNDPRDFDISGFSLYMTSAEVLQIIEKLTASQPGTSIIENEVRTMCVSEEADSKIAQVSGSTSVTSKNCYQSLQYKYTSPPGIVGDYSIFINFIENIPERPDTSVVVDISYQRVYPIGHSREQVYQNVLTRYGNPSVLVRGAMNDVVQEDDSIIACWKNEIVVEDSCNPRIGRSSGSSSLYMDLRDAEFGVFGGTPNASNFLLKLDLTDRDFANERRQARPGYLETLLNERRPEVVEDTF